MDSERRGGGLNTWATWAALALSLCSVVYNVAVQAARIDENRRRVEALESRNDKQSEIISRIDVRTASIEATLKVLVPDRPGGNYGGER